MAFIIQTMYNAANGVHTFVLFLLTYDFPCDSRVDKFLAVPAGFRNDASGVNPVGFSIFDPQQMVKVTKMEQQMMQAAITHNNDLNVCFWIG